MDHEQFQTPVKTVIRKIIVYHKMPIEICNKKKIHQNIFNCSIAFL